MKLRKFFAASPGHDVMNAMTMGTIISLVIKGAIVGAIAGFLRLPSVTSSSGARSFARPIWLIPTLLAWPCGLV